MVDGQEPWTIHADTRSLQVADVESHTTAVEVRGGKSSLRRCLERLLDVSTEEQVWARGVASEEEVTRQLTRLPDSWRMVDHAIVASRRPGLDHLVVGPGGVVAVSAKRLKGQLTVYDHAILQNGHETDLLQRSLGEARKVQAALSAAAGGCISVWTILVVVGAELDVRGRPSDFDVVTSRDVRGWFSRLPGVLTPAEVDEVERATRRPPGAPEPVGQTVRGRRP